jgi:hypothetical protein
MTMKITTRLNLFIPIALSANLLVACSFSDSSGSFSDSSEGVFDIASSPLTSSSDSSQTEQEKYENDIADYTAEFVHSTSATLDAYRAHISEIAEKHSITNWENDRPTFIGIGKGLRKSGIGQPQISAFTESLSHDNPMKIKAIDEGLRKK